jgi:hypothetical protein
MAKTAASTRGSRTKWRMGPVATSTWNLLRSSASRRRLEILLVIAFVLAIASISASTVRAQSRGSATKSVWNRLVHKTGWVILGELSRDRRRWAVAVDPNIDYFSGIFEILDRPFDRRSTELPKVGERIRVMVRVSLVILDYRLNGEQRALQSPGSTTRPKGPYDETGLYLEPDSIVRVEAVNQSRPLGPGGVRVVWGRVSPLE